jgi:hypothetical protein
MDEVGIHAKWPIDFHGKLEIELAGHWLPKNRYKTETER